MLRQPVELHQTFPKTVLSCCGRYFQNAVAARVIEEGVSVPGAKSLSLADFIKVGDEGPHACRGEVGKLGPCLRN